MSNRQIEVLRNVPIFAGLGDAELIKLSKLLENKKFQAGDVLVREGDLASEMYVIFEGSVRVERERPGTDTPPLVITTLAEGSCFGEMALIDIQPRSASVVAETSGEMEIFHNGDFLQLSEWNIHSFALIVMNIAREISRRLRGANKTLLELSKSGEPEGEKDRELIHRIGRSVP